MNSEADYNTSGPGIDPRNLASISGYNSCAPNGGNQQRRLGNVPTGNRLPPINQGDFRMPVRFGRGFGQQQHRPPNPPRYQQWGGHRRFRGGGPLRHQNDRERAYNQQQAEWLTGADGTIDARQFVSDEMVANPWRELERSIRISLGDANTSTVAASNANHSIGSSGMTSAIGDQQDDAVMVNSSSLVESTAADVVIDSEAVTGDVGHHTLVNDNRPQ